MRVIRTEPSLFNLHSSTFSTPLKTFTSVGIILNKGLISPIKGFYLPDVTSVTVTVHMPEKDEHSSHFYMICSL